jgi:hypothetical protein
VRRQSALCAQERGEDVGYPFVPSCSVQMWNAPVKTRSSSLRDAQSHASRREITLRGYPADGGRGKTKSDVKTSVILIRRRE